jgi:hypothetical protein
MSEHNSRINNTRPAHGPRPWGPRPGGARPGGPGPGGPMMLGEKAKDFKGSMAKLIKYLNQYKISIIIVFVFAAASAAFSIVGPKILGRATTKLFEGIISKISGTGDGIDFQAIGSIILFCSACI